MVRYKISLFGLACVVALLVPTPSYGSFIDGSQLNLSGDGVVGATFLNWLCDQPGDTTCPVADHGDFSVGSSTGTFAQYNSTFGLIANINNAAQPLNTLFSLPNFITFDLNGNETIELTFIPLGTDTPSDDCVGLTHCTPKNAALITVNNPLGLSAFNLDQNALGTAASFAIRGIVHDISGSTANLIGIFTAQFANETPAEVLASISGGLSSTYSASMVLAVVPEPAAMALLGTGLLGLALLGRRRKK